jgi:cell division protein FtsI (penicillin-binding protein 3)
MTHDYKIRTSLIFFVFCLLYLLILFNLYSIQIKQRAFFADLANKQYHVTVTTMPPRAEILDRLGNPLAVNQDSLSAFILPKEIKDRKKLISFLKKYFPQAVDRLKKAEGHFMYIKRKLTPDQVELIQKSGLEDIFLLKEPSRYYPLASAGAITGITDIDNVGMFGIELLHNNTLAGKASTHMLDKDARSGHFYFKKETKVEGHDGAPIQLTIDSDLQFLAHEELKNTVEKFEAKEGSIIILNPANGEILAMTSYPNFDPNDSTKINMELTKNKLVTDVYEPGSIIKVFLALAALEEGVVTADELIDCENIKIGSVNGIPFSTVHPLGIASFETVIAESNNFGVAKVALRLGPKLYDHYKRLGFGKKTSLGWPGEQPGFVNPPKKWSRGSVIVLSFGYEITSSLLQLAQAFSVIASNGYLVEPKLLLTAPEKKSAKPIYSAKTIATMRNILEKAIEEGTGQYARIKGYRVMGKTGTAKLAQNGKYTDHLTYSFAGVVEKGDYKRVIVTFVKDSPHKVYAATVAAPLFEKVAEKVLIHDKII